MFSCTDISMAPCSMKGVLVSKVSGTRAEDHFAGYAQQSALLC